MSHHKDIFNADGERVGFIRVTNQVEVLSIWINWRNTMTLFKPESKQTKLDRQ
jgi:hypothetical protein